jgi:hypothetical protein
MLVKRNRSLILFFFFSLLILSACSEEKLNSEDAVKIYVETSIAEEKYSYDLDLLRTQKQKIFDNYKSSAAEFNSYLINLKHDNEKWMDFFKKAEEYLSYLKNSEGIH